MISSIMSIDRKDESILEKEIRSVVAHKTDEYLEIYYIHSKEDYVKLIEEPELADIIVIDVTLKRGIKYVERLREVYPKSAIVIIAEIETSPLLYMKPSIMASSLILKPFEEERITEVFKDVFDRFIVKADDEDLFVINTREEKFRLPISSILYFESREKKIYACTASEEYGFYDTLDKLDEKIGEGFIRCHRSFMVNKKYIDKVKLSQNYILLKQGAEVPLSRSYKSEIKGLGY